MPGIQTFDTDNTLATLRDEWLYTMARLQKSPYTVAFVADFQAVGAKLDAASATQATLDDAATTAVAARDAADETLNPLVVQLAHAILAVTKNDRSDPHFVSYFGTQTPSEVTRPVLGPELATVAEWVAPLKAETDPGIHAVADPMEKAVAAGTAAEADVKATAKALSDFRLTGNRKKATDAFNAARGNLYGSLIKFQHDNPDLRLPSDWPAQFFKHTVKAAKYGNTSAEAQGHIDRLAAETTAAQAHQAELKAKEDALALAKKKRDDAQAQLATPEGEHEGGEGQAKGAQGRGEEEDQVGRRRPRRRIGGGVVPSCARAPFTASASAGPRGGRRRWRRRDSDAPRPGARPGTVRALHTRSTPRSYIVHPTTPAARAGAPSAPCPTSRNQELPDETPPHARHPHGLRHVRPRLAGQRRQQEIEQAFAKLDTDKDGKISREEAKSGPRLSPHFNEVNADKDGYITRADLKAFLEAHR